MAIIKRRELTEEEMKEVDGGALFYYQDIDENGCTTTFEVIDDITGDVVKVFVNDISGAYRFCKQNGYSDEVVSWPELKKIRDNYRNSNREQ